MESFPPFCLIMDTTGTTHYLVEKYISGFLIRLTLKIYTVKDSFEEANKTNQILPVVRNSDEFVFVPLDAVSLFTYVPLKKYVDIILKHINSDKEITTTLTTRTLKKLILDTCEKTSFSFSCEMYRQTDSVSMKGSPAHIFNISLRPVFNTSQIFFPLSFPSW